MGKGIQEMNKNEIISKDLMTIPNAISFIRIILITPFVAFFITGYYIPAAVTVALSGLSDCFDGMIARHFHQESEIGKILDPLADKLTLIAIGICLIFVDPYVLPLMIVMVVKDILMIIGGTIVIKRGIIPPKSVWYGKVSTILFYLTVSAIVLMTILDYHNTILTLSLLGATLAIMLYSLAMYTIKFFKLMKENKTKSDD